MPAARRRDARRGRRGRRRGLPVLGAHQGERHRHRRSDSRRRKLDGRSHRARHLVRLAHGGRRDDHERRERRLRAARRHLGVARRGLERADEPRGAHRGGARGLLLDGALARARAGRHACREARRRRDRDVRPGHGDHEGRAHRARVGARPRRGGVPRTRPRARRRTARSRRRSPRCPRSRSTRRSPRRVERRRGLPSGDGASSASSTSSTAPTRRRRSACPTLRSTTTTARLRTRAGG